MPDPEIDSITVDGTKYTFVEDQRGGFRIDRYNEPWVDADTIRHTSGVKALIALFFEAVRLRRRVAQLEKACRDNGLDIPASV